MITALAIFVALIITLSLLRSRLVYELSGTSLLLFGSTSPGLAFYSFLFLPGTIIHELSHWIVAEVLQVRTGAINIFPDLQDHGGGERRLGSVATEKSDPFRAFFIGIAPFISGLAILAVLSRLLSVGWGNLLWWQLTLLIYGIMVIGNSMMISESDRRTWPIVILLLALISILIYKYYPRAILDNQSFIESLLTPLNQVLGVTAGINLVMIGGSYGLRRLIEIITKRRIV